MELYKIEEGKEFKDKEVRGDLYGDTFNNNKQEETTVKEVFAQAFQIREDRNRFIMRVYAILSCQLLFTAGTIHAFHLYPAIQEYMLYNPLGRKGMLVLLFACIYY